MKNQHRIVWLFLLLFIGTGFKIEAQLPLSREERKMLVEADDYADQSRFQDAIEIYQKLLGKYPSNPDLNYKVGQCIFERGQNRLQSFPYFERAQAGHRKEAFYYLGRCYHLLEEFQPAVQYYQRYKNAGGTKKVELTEVDRYIDISLRAKDQIQAPNEASVTNLGLGLNSPFMDYHPVITANDSMMLFTSRRSGGVGGTKNDEGTYREDIYVAFKERGSWTTPRNIGAPVNSDHNDAVVSISPNGKYLVLYRSMDDVADGDLYWSEHNGTTWTEPKKFGANINSGYSETSACIDATGNMMYFTSNRPGGYGGTDLYRAVKFGNGDWSNPMNLGPTVNSPYDEEAPFLRPNGKELYFSSRGHQNIGGYDIFLAELNDANEWTTPQNLGFPINTVDDDMNFILTQDGSRGYLATQKHAGSGDRDIFEVLLPDQTQYLTIVKGFVTANGGAFGVASKITVIDEDSKVIQGVYNSQPGSGKYMMVLNPNTNYRMIVESDGYVIHTDEFSYTVQDCLDIMNHDIELNSK